MSWQHLPASGYSLSGLGLRPSSLAWWVSTSRFLLFSRHAVTSAGLWNGQRRTTGTVSRHKASTCFGCDAIDCPVLASVIHRRLADTKDTESSRKQPFSFLHMGVSTVGVLFNGCLQCRGIQGALPLGSRFGDSMTFYKPPRYVSRISPAR